MTMASYIAPPETEPDFAELEGLDIDLTAGQNTENAAEKKTIQSP